MQSFKAGIIKLVTETSTNLPPDVRAAMAEAVSEENPATSAGTALSVIATNIDMACDTDGPICQDTGMPTFEIKTPVGANQIVMQREIREAISEATKRGKLRPNSVDSITGANSGDNLGPGTPVIHFHQWENDDEIEVKLLLKGGGCENKNIQYSVPAELPHLGRAGRDLDGVRKCILHAVWQAQGQGCSAGAIGVCIGGVRAVMGKGGMGKRTLDAMQEAGAVYLNAIGGAAQYYARCIEQVLDVNLLEFGIPEAMWHLRVKDFPAIVTMDAHGNSLHADVEKASATMLSKLADPVF